MFYHNKCEASDPKGETQRDLCTGLEMKNLPNITLDVDADAFPITHADHAVPGVPFLFRRISTEGSSVPGSGHGCAVLPIDDARRLPSDRRPVMEDLGERERERETKSQAQVLE